MYSYYTTSYKFSGAFHVRRQIAMNTSCYGHKELLHQKKLTVYSVVPNL
jgi:hypothetical protein